MSDEKKSDGKKPDEKKLTIKQKKFVDGYLATGNGSEAARQAGYSEKCSGAQSVENLQKPLIRDAIRSRLDAAGIPEARLLKTLSAGLEANMVKTASSEGEITDEKVYADHSVRHKYLDTGLKLRDLYPAERHEVTQMGEFDGWTEEELIHYAETGERPDHG